MRQRVWRWVRRRVPEGELLPLWLIVIRFLLYPIDTTYWKMSETKGYQVYTDTWLINGIRYSGVGLALLAESGGELYRVTRLGDVVSLHHVDEGAPK